MGAALALTTGQNLPRVRDFRPQELNLIRQTVASDTNPQEFDLFIEVCRRVGLDPFRKQIYAVVYNKDKPDSRKMSIITGIDGYRSIAARSGAYRPDDQEPTIETDPALAGPTNPKGIVRAVVRCYRFGPDREWHPCVGVAYWEEYAPITAAEWEWVDTGEKWADSGKPKKKRQPKPGTDMKPEGKWATMPHVMLAKCAEAQALRKGWPEDLSGVYVAEEMAQAEIIEVSATVAADSYQAERAQKAIGTAGSVFIAWRAGEPIDTVPAGQMVDRCGAFFRESDSSIELTAWRDRNQRSLQDFWARHKSDALEVKRLLEARIAELEAA